MNRPNIKDFAGTFGYRPREYADELDKYIDQLEQSKESLLGSAKPWPLVDVLKKLTEVADILLHKKDYDGHGWEEMEVCFKRGKEIIDSIDYE